ncbi:MATE family efflux transporter [Cohnella sp. CFH 77786]|uniref:MATE family efflux transporter n=1 Tax=Cohnella sp. CFH 77786 TaxID=2662265 RepID=UPI0021081DFA|nr:MATE family efflux transporter [Cohnella sp. CFH 77786]
MFQPSGSKLSIYAITWPIFVESALQMFLRISDTFMLSKVSDDAVAAVGVANQLVMFCVLIFSFISIGTTVVVSQFLGAGLNREIPRLTGAALAINFLSGIAISALVVAFGGPFLRLLGLDGTLLSLGRQYLAIAGGALVVQALLTAVTSVIQAFGLTRQTMLVTIGMNIMNVCGNYLFIYGALGFPKLGVTGVAISTACSQFAGLIVNLVLLRRTTGVRVTLPDFWRWKREHVGKVLKVGVPSSAVTLSYVANQFVITAMIATLGAQMLAAKIYTQNIMFVVMILAGSLGRGVQIIVGRLIGAGRLEEAYRQVLLNLARSVVITLAGVSVLCLARVPLLRLFTQEPAIIALGATLLLLSFLLEPGRNLNVIIERSLQAAGDARFPMWISIAVSWLFSLPLAYYLGIHREYGLIGFWSAFVVDEWLRGLILLIRWRSKSWTGHSLVSGEGTHTAG